MIRPSAFAFEQALGQKEFEWLFQQPVYYYHIVKGGVTAGTPSSNSIKD
jgi:hypothetical protein